MKESIEMFERLLAARDILVLRSTLASGGWLVLQLLLADRREMETRVPIHLVERQPEVALGLLSLKTARELQPDIERVRTLMRLNRGGALSHQN